MSTPLDPPPRSGLRVGDAERNAAADALQQHLTAGRLTLDEYAERSAVVANSRTQGEIDAMFTDLPPIAGAMALSHPTPAAQPPAPWAAAATPAVPDRANRAVQIGVVAAMPFIALILFLVTHQWWFFLLVPLVGALMGPMIGNRDDDGDGRRRDRRRR